MFGLNFKNIDEKNKIKICLIILLTSNIIFLLSIHECFESNINPIDTEYGMFEILPNTYYISCFLLVVAFVYNLFYIQNKKISVILTLFLILYLYLTPALIYDIPRFSTVYKHYGYVDYIMTYGHINPSETSIQNNYHCWPNAWILGDYLLSIFGVSDHLIMLAIFPFIAEIMFLPLLYVFLKKIFGEFNIIWMGIWTYYLFNWINQDYYSAQFFAYYLYFIILYVVLFVKKYEFPVKITSAIITLSLIGYHIITPIMLLFTLIMIYVMHKDLRRKVAYFLSIVLVLYIIWMIYIAYPYFQPRISMVFNAVLNSLHGNVGIKTISQKTWVNPTYKTIVNIRMFCTSLMLLLAGIQVIKLFIQNKGDCNLKIKNLKYLIIGFFQYFMVILPGYAFEGMMRGIYFSMPLIIGYSAKSIIEFSKNRKILLVLFLLLLFPLHIFSHYGDDSINTIQKSSIYQTNFIYNHVNLIEKTKIASYYLLYSYKHVDKIPVSPSTNLIEKMENIGKYEYIAYSNPSANLKYFNGESGLKKFENLTNTLNMNYSKIYTSGNYTDLFITR
ncbi:hypothetical protein MMKA1_03820 [Methanococcus maripaludis KA1]|uniref:Glycosyltransferase RgtA/B/C/D-like domain-containing protein n=1 Tax=Methanococcus maripaludis KA1 TaxID=637914 RepID=A0A2Z5PCT9_METMI|nr:hypothetical protein [Methanococcus maripaludis]BAP60499.1 hypothetical protein MMKA1_03820 [Methanococcus maripaludis KA1]